MLYFAPRSAKTSLLSGIIFALNGSTLNTAATGFRIEYWNGDFWQYLPAVHGMRTNGSFFTQSAFLFKFPSMYSQGLGFTFVIPDDWTALPDLTAGIVATKFIRIRALDANFSGAISIDFTGSGYFNMPSSPILAGAAVAQWVGGGKAYAFLLKDSSTDALKFNHQTSVFNSTEDTSYMYRSVGNASTLIPYQYEPPAVYTLVPEVNELYCAYNYEMYVMSKGRTWSRTAADAASVIVAKGESGSSVVGTGPDDTLAPFNPEFVPQLSEFPKAKYLMYHKGLLWAAHEVGNQYLVRWSGPVQFGLAAHRVWPLETQAMLTDGDNSSITGLASLDEHLLVFKQDSIWRMVFQEVNEERKLSIFDPVKIANGIGTVSHHSITMTPKGLVFLYEDGVYLFNGVQASGISGSISSFIKKLNWARAEYFTATTWRAEKVVLLAVSTAGSGVNNAVIVWDYDNDAWWIWEDINVYQWLPDGSGYNREVMRFIDSTGRICELGGRDDNGTAIDAYAITHRFGYKDERIKRFREVRVLGTNEVTSLNVGVFGMDKDLPTLGALSYTDPAQVAPSSFIFNSSAFRQQRYVSRRQDTRVDGQWAQVKIQHSTKNQVMQVSQVSVGAEQLGYR
jgi:hypothetical protein